jgi:hypothetical protein
MDSNVTLVLTSCDRHDLLKITLDSFIACSDEQPQETIIIEDSTVPMPQWLEQNLASYSSRLGPIQWVQNDARMGQIFSIDRAYSRVRTDYIFHCEDDWRFVGRDFMRESRALLEEHPDVALVSLRGNSGWHPLIRRGKIWIAEPNWHGGLGGICFNLGLRRTAEYQKIGSYGQHISDATKGFASELELSRKFLSLGYVIADLNRVVVVHTGGDRSRANPYEQKKGFWHRFRHKARRFLRRPT